MNIKIRGLSKVYKNGTVALANVNLNINNGAFGLLGPNGAGKTTLLRILATVMSYESGEISVNGLNLKESIFPLRQIIGYLPQEFGLYPNLTLEEFLDYICLLCEINCIKERKERIDNAIEVTDLQSARHKKLRTFSGGMKRRAGIAQCLLNDPQIIIVDEPTAGLDPEQRIKIKNLIAGLARDRIVLFSTHIISDLENVCSELAILDGGRLKFVGGIHELAHQTEMSVWVGECDFEENTVLKKDYLVIKQSLSGDYWDYRVIGKKPPFSNSRKVEMNLEDAYMAFMFREKEGIGYAANE